MGTKTKSQCNRKFIRDRNQFKHFVNKCQENVQPRNSMGKIKLNNIPFLSFIIHTLKQLTP